MKDIEQACSMKKERAIDKIGLFLNLRAAASCVQ